MKNIPRPIYLQKVEPFIGKNIIKVLVGQRRVGKSYLLRQIIDRIVKKFPNAPTIYINKELFEFDFIQNYSDLIQFVESQSKGSSKTFLFIDEIQDIKQFERALRHFQAKESFDIYCTGSNADLLSGELATLLSGRYVEVKIYGLSYEEFLTFHGLNEEPKTLQNYLLWGNLPFLINLNHDQETMYEYLRNIFSTIVYKDIIGRYHIRNTQFLENLVKFLANNVGHIISAKKISDYLKSQRLNISPQMVLTYLDYLQNAFLVFKVKRAEVGGKRIFTIGDKYYFEDWGIRNALIGFNPLNIQQIIENVVYLHLKIHGFDVYVGQCNSKEIDFIAEKEGKILYVQTAYLLSDEKVRQREFGNLQRIKDHWPKMVVSMDDFPMGNYQGIEHVPLREFLLRTF